MEKIITAQYIYSGNEFKKAFAIYVADDKIADLGSQSEIKAKYPQAAITDYGAMVLVPGTINTHNHSFQSLLRGIAIDKPFLTWRDESLYKYSPAMRKQDIYTGALFAFAEMMKCGVTTVCDYFYLHNYGQASDELVIKAAHDIGIRLVLARTMYDWDGAPAGYLETINEAVDNTLALAARHATDPMVTVLPAPHSLHGASPEMIVAGHDLAKKMGTKFHMHVAEEPFEVEDTMKKHHGLRTVEYLNELGVVDEHLAIVHGVWLNAGEIKLLGDKGACLNYCPSSNMFLADGITDLPDMMHNHINIALGSDGACSNNRISVFEEMRMASLLQKASTHDALVVKCTEAFNMGTKNGGQQLDIAAGEIKIGQFADLVGIDLNDLSMQPVSADLEQLLPNIVYSMQPSAIKTVIVAGRETVVNGELVTVPENKVLDEIHDTMGYFETIR